MKAVTFVHSEGIYNKENSYKDDEKIIQSLEIIYRNFKIRKIYEIIEKLHIKISIKFLKEQRKKYYSLRCFKFIIAYYARWKRKTLYVYERSRKYKK